MPQRIPRRLKEMRGTLRKDRDNPNAPKLKPGRVPPPPKSLRSRERAIELAEEVEYLGIYTPAFLTAFKLMVRVLAVAEDPAVMKVPTAHVRALQAAASLMCASGWIPSLRRASEREAERARSLRGFFVRPGLQAARRATAAAYATAAASLGSASSSVSASSGRPLAARCERLGRPRARNPRVDLARV
jgi:hypothetical protein